MSLEHTDSVKLQDRLKMKKNCFGLLLIVLCIFSPVFLSAQEEYRLYDLKAKLSPKTVDSRVYWQGRKDMHWQDEIENWNFGFLSADRIVPPLIINQDNFYPVEGEYQEKYFWGNNNMKIEVLNPHKTSIVCSLEFYANSYGNDRDLEIWVNGKKKQQHINVPANDGEFTGFKIENIVLLPGISDVVFVCPEGTDKLILKQGEEKTAREVSIRFKEDIRFRTKQFVGDDQTTQHVKYQFFPGQQVLDVLALSEKNIMPFILMSRDLSVDIDEYPWFKFECYSKGNAGFDFKAYLCLDYDNDGTIDDYLKLDTDDDGEVDVASLIKDNTKNIFGYLPENPKVLKTILLGIPDKSLKVHSGLQNAEFQIKDFYFFNPNKALFIPLRIVDVNNWKLVECLGVMYKSFKDAESKSLMFNAYFDSRQIGAMPVRGELDRGVNIFLKDNKKFSGEIAQETQDIIKLKNVQELDGGTVDIRKGAVNYGFVIEDDGKREGGLEEERLSIEFGINPISSPGIVKFIYKLEDPAILEFDLFLNIETNDAGPRQKKILAGEKEELDNWMFLASSGNVDLYKTKLSEKFPAEYSTRTKDLERFIVYKDKVALQTTCSGWHDGEELVEVGAEARRIVVSVPRGKVPDANYSIVYYPASKKSFYEGYHEYEADTSWLAQEIAGTKIKSISVNFKRKHTLRLTKEKQGWYGFSIKNLGIYHKFAYPLKSRKDDAVELLKQVDIPLLEVDAQIFSLTDFENWTEFADLKGRLLKKKIKISKGDHEYEQLENETFDLAQVILEPAVASNSTVASQEPEIIFKRMNPSKYLVSVKGAKDPFWLVFSESFHAQWKLYQCLEQNSQPQEDIVAEYPHLNVKEAKHSMRFIPGDVSFLLRDPLVMPHQIVNGFANGWYIEPKKVGLGEDFTLILYFYPQSLFYLGLLIAVIALTGGIGYVMYCKKHKR